MKTNYIKKQHVHCSTICQHKDGVLLAYYVGPECRDEQHVQIEFYTNDELKSSYTLHKKTGNCILIPQTKNEAIIIYSHFNDTNGITYPNNPVERWAYCSNWVSIITTLNDTIVISEPMPLNTQPGIGYLTRCAPIYLYKQWLLPIYHEKPGYGTILKSQHGLNWRTAGHIGLQLNKCIQPTIWEYGNTIYSLSRNTSKTHKTAWYSYSNDFGETWNDIVSTSIDNTNNSLVVINNNNKNPLIVWNKGYGRHNLMLGRLNQDDLTIKQYKKLNRGPTGSYPNYCFDNDGSLHIVHTDHLNIAHHIFTENDLKF